MQPALQLFFLCYFGTVCGSNEFECQYGECVSEDLVCDGNKDCSNNRDEVQNCDG